LLILGLHSTTYAQDRSSVRQQDTTRTTARAESTSTDSMKSGYNVERNPSEQNPPGYRGMERPAALSDSGATADSSAPGDATSRVNQMKREDSGTVETAAKKTGAETKHVK